MGKQLDEYKQQVRKVAIRVASEQGWCDDGLNKVLEELGLPAKQRFIIPVRVTSEMATSVVVDDVASYAEAVERVKAMESVAPPRGTYQSHKVPDHVSSPVTVNVGDRTSDLPPDWYVGILGNCGARPDTGYFTCTRPPHEGTHVAANESYVVAVWGGEAVENRAIA